MAITDAMINVALNMVLVGSVRSLTLSTIFEPCHVAMEACPMHVVMVMIKANNMF